MTESSNSAKKSLYLFMSSMLGVLLFLILHRLAVFFYLVAVGVGGTPAPVGYSYLVFLAVDFFTLILTLMLGAWYGIWVGMYWYEQVYEKGSHEGLVGYFRQRYWPRKSYGYGLGPKIAEAQRKLENDRWELEGLVSNVPTDAGQPLSALTRKIVRKRAPKKLRSK